MYISVITEVLCCNLATVLATALATVLVTNLVTSIDEITVNIDISN